MADESPENVEGFQVAKRRSGFVSDVSVTLISCHNDCVQEGVTQEAVAVAARTTKEGLRRFQLH